MGAVDLIEAAFARVKSSSGRVVGGDGLAKDEAYQDIFALNNEIGRLARGKRGAMARMKELQACVNMITVGIKYDKAAEVREGLAVTEESVSSLRRELADEP
ncbi:MAG: hypothetical protein JRN58_07380 [Nitrososphaerota archaeon]|nr:hypothetical protein [Nitrososphaerota archaeon]MDG7021776.1 hypothetical protein [Nitrososphaerota archaeon]